MSASQQEWLCLQFADGGSCISVQVSCISQNNCRNGLIGFILTETIRKTLTRAPPVASLCVGWSAGMHSWGGGEAPHNNFINGQSCLLSHVPVHAQSNHCCFQCQIFKNTTDPTPLSISSSTDYTGILLIRTSWDCMFLCIYMYTHMCIPLDALATKSW